MKPLPQTARSVRVMLLLGIFALGSLYAAAQWRREGSAPAINGQVEGIEDKEVAGAVQRLAPDPGDPNILYAGAVNGGVWVTRNALNVHPNWKYLSFDMPGQSIGALELDPMDHTHQTLVAGIGRFSSYEEFGAGSFGVFRMRTEKGTWENLDPNSVFQDRHILGIAARGSTIVTANDSDGIWRTDNNGKDWIQMSGKEGSGLPVGRSYALAGDPVSLGILYAHAGSRVYKSTDTGATWKRISNLAMEGHMLGLRNLKIAVGRANNVYVAIVRATTHGGILQAVYRSGNGGTSWSPLDLPMTEEKSQVFGIHPGEQGNLHISLAADPISPTIAYLGGDRQPYENEPDTPMIRNWKNSLGAEDFSGRLFRLDASLPPGEQDSSLTHSGTAHNSAPHADSRFICFDAVGNLLESDDGGVYKRTKPAGKEGDWFSLNGDLNVTEIHSVAWDEKAQIILSGAQDNGSPQQQVPSNIKWDDLSTGDGGDVSVDNLSSSVYSIRYSSAEGLQEFQRTVWSAKNELIRKERPQLYDPVANATIADFDFVTPIRLNSRNGQRLLIATTKALYESLDQGTTVRLVGPFRVNGNSRHALSYGAADNEDIIYAGSSDSLLIRSDVTKEFVLCTSYPGGRVEGIVLNPSLSADAFVINAQTIYHTTDTGRTWTELTGNLPQLHAGSLYAVSYVPGDGVRPAWVAVGSDNGVFYAAGPDFNAWKRLGNELPSIAVFDLEYDLKDKILIAGTMGLGAWSYRF